MTQNRYQRPAVGNVGRSAPKNSSYAENPFSTRQFKADFYEFDRGAYQASARNNRKKRPEENLSNTGKIRNRGKAGIGEARREAGERRRNVERRRGLFFGFTVLLMFLAILFLIYKFVFVVRDISVEGTDKYTVEEIIEASGLSSGVNLYSFRESTVSKKVSLECPYISAVDVKRDLPSKVTLCVSEDVPKYYAVIFGEYKILSEGLRVLDTAKEKDELPAGLVRLKLPSVSYSIEGRVIRFASAQRERGIRDLLEAVSASDLSHRVTTIDTSDRFDISVVCDSKFKLVLGDAEGVELQLKTAASVLQDEMFTTDNKIRVDLTTEGKTGVVIDNLMELE